MSEAAKTHKLLYPITVKGREITEIIMRRVKVSDLGAARRGKDEHEQTKIMLTRIAELTPDEVDALDAVDWTSLSDEMIDFLVPPQDKKLPLV